MLLYRNNHGHETSQEANGTLDKAARTIAGAILYRQRQLAGCCSARYERLTARDKLVALLLFCLLFGTASLWFLAKGVWPQQEKQTVIQLQSSYSDSLQWAQPGIRDSLHLNP